MENIETRELIAVQILDKINTSLKLYYEKYKDNIGFILYYPLIKLEDRFNEEDPNHQNAEYDRKIISWFIKEIFKYEIEAGLIFEFKQAEYEQFEILYKEIYKMYSDFTFVNELQDSITGSKIIEKETLTYEIITPLIQNKYRKEIAYYYGLFNKEESEKEKAEIMKVVEYVMVHHTTPNLDDSLQKLQNLLINIDNELLELCQARVYIDLRKLGENVRSESIKDIDTLKQVLGYLFYLAHVSHIKNFFHRLKGTNIDDKVISIPKPDLISNIRNITEIRERNIKQVIGLLTMLNTADGSLVDFPLIQYNESIIFIPSSIMLNDWQFSIVNAHHYKRKEFTNRHLSVSNSVLLEIENCIKRFDNIEYCIDKKYQFKDDNEETIRGDIDIAIYDNIANKLLIIECKWKDNHYHLQDFENFKKVYNTLKEIYREQISKHRMFLEGNITNISYIFNNNIKFSEASFPEIFYFAVDKRSQFYTDCEYMLPLYLLISIFNEHSIEKQLLTVDIINEIMSLKTEILYFNASEQTEIVLENNITVISDELYYKYNI